MPGRRPGAGDDRGGGGNRRGDGGRGGDPGGDGAGGSGAGRGESSGGDGTGTVREFYARWAGLYDLIARHAPRVGYLRRRAVDALRLEPGDTVLDVGCGTGANLPHLRRAVGPDGRVVGVDVTDRALRVARRRERGRPHGGGRRGGGSGDGSRGRGGTLGLVRGDGARLPVAGPVDAVLGTFVVGMFDDPASVVDRWCDLAPGGHVVLVDAARTDRRGPGARAINAAFDAATALSTPPTTRLRYDRDLGRDLHRTVLEARATLRDRAVAHAHEEHLLGVVRLTGGRMPATDAGGDDG